MPAPDGTISLALDFDGSLVEDHVMPLRWRRGAREFVVAAAAAGIKLWLFSCRCQPVGVRDLSGDAEDFWRAGRASPDAETSWRLREEMVAFLRAEGVWPLLAPWDAPGKPMADSYIDDKGDAPDWIVIAGELGVRLGHGVRPEQSPPLGPGILPPAGALIEAAERGPGV